MNAPPAFRAGSPTLLIAGAMLAAVLVYLPGLSGDFVFDDIWNIVRARSLHATTLDPVALRDAVRGGDAGPLGRPLATLSFAVNHAWSGLDPTAFKAVNLGIHLAVGWLLYVLGRRLARAAGLPADTWLPAATAAAWLLHPLNLTGVLYVVQRMTSLAALFTVAGTIAYVAGRERILRGRGGGWWRIGVAAPACGVLAVLCKETGALLPLYLLVIEVTVFGFTARRPRDGRVLAGIAVLVVAVPLMAAAAWLATGDWLAELYRGREFTLGERLLTQPRVLGFYLRLLVAPTTGALGLYHDDFAVSSSLFEPPATVIGLALIALLVVVAARVRRRAPLAALGIGWFLAGHLLESTVLPLELVHEHRNYLPGWGILLALAVAVRAAAGERPARAAALAVVTLTALAGITAQRAWQWGDPLRLARAEATHHPDSARAQHEAGEMHGIWYRRNGKPHHLHRAREHFQRAMAIDPGPATYYNLLVVDPAAATAPAAAEWRTLADLLRTGRAWYEGIAVLKSVLGCRHRGCAADVGTMRMLVDAYIANPAIDDRRRAHAQSILAQFLRERGDIAGARIAIERAVAHAPDEPLPWLGLTSARIEAGDLPGAAEALARAGQLDRRDRYRRMVAARQRALQAALAADERPPVPPAPAAAGYP